MYFSNCSSGLCLPYYKFSPCCQRPARRCTGQRQVKAPKCPTKIRTKWGKRTLFDNKKYIFLHLMGVFGHPCGLSGHTTAYPMRKNARKARQIPRILPQKKLFSRHFFRKPRRNPGQLQKGKKKGRGRTGKTGHKKATLQKPERLLGCCIHVLWVKKRPSAQDKPVLPICL